MIRGYYAHMANNRHVISNGMRMKKLYVEIMIQTSRIVYSTFCMALPKPCWILCKAIMPHVCCAMLSFAHKSLFLRNNELNATGKGTGNTVAIFNGHYNHLVG